MILILDILERIILNKFIILEGEKNLYKNQRNKNQKWNWNKDNELIMIDESYVFLLN